MGFTRNWDATCPRTWDQWEQDGVSWVIQDLPPEDDEKALQTMVNHFLEDETLCSSSGLHEEPESVQGIVSFWRDCLKQRMSLACYATADGERQLVGINICVVDSAEKRFPSTPIVGTTWNNVYQAVEYLETKCDPFKYLKLDIMFHAFGLCVKKEYRGFKLGSRILEARRPLCLAHGIKATATMFTGPASQKSAARAGFETICVVSLKELADNGMKYPPDENLVIKLMVKRYDEE